MKMKWAVAGLTMILLVGASVAAGSASVRVGAASGEVAADAEARNGDPPEPRAAGNGTNKTNETPPPPPPPPTNNTTEIQAPVLSPDHQNVSGGPNATTFALTVTNPATKRQTVSLAAVGPPLWHVSLSASNVSLAPGESYAFTGSIRLVHHLGGTGTIVVTATGPGGADNATVHACVRGLLQSCPTSNGTEPPTNGTRPGNETPPGNGTNGTKPPTNGTQPPTNGTQPPTNGTEPPTNGTQPPTNGSDSASGASSSPASPPTALPPEGHAALLQGVPREVEGIGRSALDGV